MLKTKNMMKNILVSAVALLSLSFFTSCHEQRDMEDDLMQTVRDTKVSSLPKHTERLAFNLDFSLSPLEVDVPAKEQDDFRSLQYKLFQTGTTIKQGRKIEYKFADGEELDAMLILRCNGQMVNASATDDTQVPMPYFHRMIKLTYHQATGRFTCATNHFDYEWNGPVFELIKNNTSSRQWQVKVVLTKSMSNLVSSDSDKPLQLQVPVGDITPDGVDSENEIDPQTPIYNMKEQLLTETGFKDISGVSDETEVPFCSDWVDIAFSNYGGGASTDASGQHNKTEKPVYSFDVAPKTDGSKGDNIHLKPQGVMVLLDFNTANTTPFDIHSRGMHIQSSAYSFAGHYDFSEAAMRDNDGEPKWIPSDTFKKYESSPGVNIYGKNFRFVDANNQGSEIVFEAKNTTSKDHYYLFWAMPLDIKGVPDTQYFTQFYLNCKVGGDVVQGGYGDPNESEKYIRTNYNIAKIDKGEVAAMMPGRHGFSADDILDGEFGKAKAYVRHGLVGNRKVWLQMPSVKNFPLYSSKGKCAYSSDEAGRGKGVEGKLKHGRIMFATTQTITRPIMFLEYMSETPCVNTRLVMEHTSRIAGVNYWKENVRDLMAYRLTPHWGLRGADFMDGAGSDVRGDEFHFAYDYARDLASSHTTNSYGYQNVLPENISYGTYFRESTREAGSGRMLTLETPPNPTKNNTVKEVWYYVKFKNTNEINLVLEEQGEGQFVIANRRELGKRSQLWKLCGRKGNFELYSYNGNRVFYLDRSTGRFRTKFKENEDMKLFEHNGNVLMAPFWDLSNSINIHGGYRPGSVIGLFGNDSNDNALEFYDEAGNRVAVNDLEYSDRGVGPWRITQNFTSQLPFEDQPKQRHTYVWKANNSLVYAVRYMDHEDDVTCTANNHRASTTHEDGKWENCNRRRCVVRYQTSGYLYSVTARYVGVNDALANIENPVWANENFWKNNQEDDVVRYYHKGYGYIYMGTYFGMKDSGIYWTSQDALPGAPANSKEILNMDCGIVNGNYGAYHPYGCIRLLRNRQDRLPFYLFMDIKDWRDVPTHRGYSR